MDQRKLAPDAQLTQLIGGPPRISGIVKLHARGGQRVEILPRMWTIHDRGIDCGRYLHDMLYVAAHAPRPPLTGLEGAGFGASRA